MPNNYNLPDENVSWREWHVPIKYDNFTLRQVLQSAEHNQASQVDIPLIIKMIENPKFDLPWIEIFNGSVNLADHDCIHALLGRGMLPKDEAFVIGFTMGSTNRTTTLEQKLYSLAAKYLYPGPYKFSDDDIQVFKDAVHLGYISDCEPLNQVDFDNYLDMPLKLARESLGLEKDLVQAYYEIEKKRYPDSRESQRLI